MKDTGIMTHRLCKTVLEKVREHRRAPPSPHKHTRAHKIIFSYFGILMLIQEPEVHYHKGLPLESKLSQFSLEILGFCHSIVEFFVLVGHCMPLVGSLLPVFWYNIFLQS